jgi:hypothetical protein
MFKTKKAGCGNYAEVSDNYMLFDKAVVPSTGGKAKKSKAKKAKKTANVKKTAMRKGKKTGGVFMTDMANATSNLLSSMPLSSSTPTVTAQAPPPPVTTTPPVATKGGSRRGGMFPPNLTDTMNNLFPTKGGKNCKSCKSKGGSLELAPFAAALAFLATRFATDKNFKMKDVFGMKSSKTKAKSKSMSKSKSLA